MLDPFQWIEDGGISVTLGWDGPADSISMGGTRYRLDELAGIFIDTSLYPESLEAIVESDRTRADLGAAHEPIKRPRPVQGVADEAIGSGSEATTPTAEQRARYEDGIYKVSEVRALLRYLSIAGRCRVIGDTHYEIWRHPTLDLHSVGEHFPDLPVLHDPFTIRIDAELSTLEEFNTDPEVVFRPVTLLQNKTRKKREELSDLIAWSKHMPIRTSPFRRGKELRFYMVGGRAAGGGLATADANSVPADLVNLSHRIMRRFEIDVACFDWVIRDDGYYFEGMQPNPTVHFESISHVADLLAREFLK